jgi:hypothetical protein
MIKFFRQIRQSLIMENKTSKYFKYAIGEIVLVVIGILIALQINNWNEVRKQKKQTHTNILSIAKDISRDTLEQNKTIKSLQKELKSGKYFIPIMESDTHFVSDSLNFILSFNTFTTVYNYPNQTNTWSLLNSSGSLAEFPDSKLLDMLQDYYDNYYSLTMNFSESTNLSRLELRKIKYELFSDSDHKKFFPTKTPTPPSKKAYQAIFNDTRILPLCRYISGGAIYFTPKFIQVNKKANAIIDYINKTYKPL